MRKSLHQDAASALTISWSHSVPANARTVQAVPTKVCLPRRFCRLIGPVRVGQMGTPTMTRSIWFSATTRSAVAGASIPTTTLPHSGLAAHLFGDGCQEGRCPGNVGFRRGEAHADAEQIQTGLAECDGQVDGFGQRFLVPAVELDDPEAGGQGQVLRPDFADGGKGFQQETAATGIISAVLVGALVGVNREETLRQIAMAKCSSSHSKPASRARRAAATKSFRTRAMSSSVIALGTFGRLAPKGTADGEIVAQPEGRPRNMVVASHGTLALALRPA